LFLTASGLCSNFREKEEKANTIQPPPFLCFSPLHKLLSTDIEVLTQAVKVMAGKEAIALKQDLVSKISVEQDDLFQRERADEAMALAE